MILLLLTKATLIADADFTSSSATLHDVAHSNCSNWHLDAPFSNT